MTSGYRGIARRESAKAKSQINREGARRAININIKVMPLPRDTMRKRERESIARIRTNPSFAQRRRCIMQVHPLRERIPPV